MTISPDFIKVGCIVSGSLFVVANCSEKPTLLDPIKYPARFPWQEVVKIRHYWLDVNNMARPVMVKENPPPYGVKRP
jgi:hypothetical protein